MAIRNIAICTTQVPFTRGGAESHVEGLKQALVEAGYNAEIVALPFKWYPPSEIMRGALAWRMIDLTEANGKPIDLVIGMKFPAYVVAHPRKVLWIIHQYRAAYNLCGTQFDDLSHFPDAPRMREWITDLDNRFIPEARKVFANSKTVAKRLWRYNRIKSEPLYHPPPRAERLREGEQGDYFFYPSRLEPQKRQEILIEAMSHTRTPVRAIFAGGTHERERYEGLLKKYDVGSKIELRGFVSDEEMIELYANALGVCYLPFDEDYGYVTIEGMMAGKPVVVAKDGGGATEFVEHDSEGLVIEPDAKSVASALDQLYSDRERAKLMGSRGREKLMAANLSWQNVVERLVSAAH
jgi:glycosyltransferase involved in cell wall biosynthesis